MKKFLCLILSVVMMCTLVCGCDTKASACALEGEKKLSNSSQANDVVENQTNEKLINVDYTYAPTYVYTENDSNFDNNSSYPSYSTDYKPVINQEPTYKNTYKSLLLLFSTSMVPILRSPMLFVGVASLITSAFAISTFEMNFHNR